MLIGLKQLLLTQTAKDSGILFIGSILATLFGFLLVVILTRNLSTNEFGLIITALVFTQLIADVSEFGINTSTLNFVSSAAKKIRDKYISVTFILRVLISIIVSAALYFFANHISKLFFNTSNMTSFIQISSIGILLFMIISWGQGVFQAERRFVVSAIAGGSINFLRTIVVVLLITLGIFNVTSIFLSIQLVLLIIVPFVLFNIGVNFFKGNVKSIDFKKVITFGLPVGFSFTLAAIYTKLDQILIFNLAGSEQAGVYGLAFRTASFLILISASLNSAFAPRFASLHPSDFPNYFNKTMYASLGLGFISLLGIPLSQLFFPLIFGEKFNAAIIPFQILLLGMVSFIIYSPFYSAIIYKFKKTKFPFLTSILSLTLVYYLLNLLIPLYQSIGAAVAVSAVYIIQMFLSIGYFIYLKREK